MNSREGWDDRSGVPGYGHRSERRSARRTARRRKKARRLFVATVPALVVIVGVVALLIILGGRADDSGAAASATTTTTTPRSTPAQTSNEPSGVLVAIEQEGSIPALVLLVPLEEGGIVLGAPGNTLIKTEQGFLTLGDLYLKEKGEEALAGLGADLGTDVASLVGVDWADVLSLLKPGSGTTWPASLTGNALGALQAAQAFLELALEAMPVEGGQPAGSAAWEQLHFTGDASALRTLATKIASSMADSWRVSILPGRKVENLDFTYYELDVTAAKELLAGGAAPHKGQITLDIQNGSGELDAAQAAGDLLRPLGFTMLPFKNATGFPDIAETTISASSDSLVDAAQVKELLEVGTVDEDDSLSPGYIRVIVGKDFTPSDSTTAGG
ncbi:MAG: LytR C-terminal domain-containing protein [Actinobacteria bacterium]|nr:LytR C-terminal domain-containing protein [Actinomycetota bacterium]